MRRLGILLLTLGGVCVALIFAQQAEKRFFGASPAPEIGSHQSPDLFGEMARASSTQSVTPALVLSGVLPNFDPKLGYAMIGSRDSSVVLYKVGDQVHDGVRLHAVYPNRVLLEVNGVIQTLSLTGAGIAIPSTPSSTSSNTLMSGYPGRQVEVPAPGLLRDALHYSEIHVAGRLGAIRVFPGRDSQMLAQLGLRPGDLIIAVDGKPVEEQPNGERALELLGNLSGGQVTIVRNGRRQDLEIHHADVPRKPLE